MAALNSAPTRPTFPPPLHTPAATCSGMTTLCRSRSSARSAQRTQTSRRVPAPCGRARTPAPVKTPRRAARVPPQHPHQPPRWRPRKHAQPHAPRPAPASHPAASPPQVGAVIVSPDNIILSIGYNGFPRGCTDDALPWAKKSRAGNVLDTKYPYVRPPGTGRGVERASALRHGTRGGVARACEHAAGAATRPRGRPRGRRHVGTPQRPLPLLARHCCLWGVPTSLPQHPTLPLPPMHTQPPPPCQVVHAEANALLNKNQASVAGTVGERLGGGRGRT